MSGGGMEGAPRVKIEIKHRNNYPSKKEKPRT
nr:MAG TPA: hypothetical protein [Caudoviricetes sp.]